MPVEPKTTFAIKKKPKSVKSGSRGVGEEEEAVAAEEEGEASDSDDDEEEE